jgi:hypothetical protein
MGTGTRTLAPRTTIGEHREHMGRGIPTPADARNLSTPRLFFRSRQELKKAAACEQKAREHRHKASALALTPITLILLTYLLTVSCSPPPFTHENSFPLIIDDICRIPSLDSTYNTNNSVMAQARSVDGIPILSPVVEGALLDTAVRQYEHSVTSRMKQARRAHQEDCRLLPATPRGSP